eukprot:scaffold9163_cov115-Skeletonema_marinoi.AAC.3
MPTMMQRMPSKKQDAKVGRMPMPSGKCEAYILSLSQLSLSLSHVMSSQKIKFGSRDGDNPVTTSYRSK